MRDAEIWNIIPGYPDYKCSTHGRIMSKAKHKIWTLLKLNSIGSHGYYVVHLRRGNSFTVHSLVALTFLGPSMGRHINHKSGIKTDNRLTNLEYVTQNENNQHALRNGLINNKGGNHGLARVSDLQALIIREAVKCGYRQCNISRYFKIPAQTINGIIKGRTYKYLPL